MSVFQGHDLVCVRGERVVFRGLGFALGAGEALVLRGPNGSGKSSLLRLMAGLLRPAAGRLTWEGEEVYRDREAHAQRLSYVGHLDAVKPVLTVAENLRFWARLDGGGGTMDAALAALGLSALADIPCRLLSAGQRRRLALARLAVAGAPLWLLDEPTVGLDSDSVERLGRLVARHRESGGMVAVATHAEVALAGAGTLDLAAHAAAPAGEAAA